MKQDKNKTNELVDKSNKKKATKTNKKTDNLVVQTDLTWDTSHIFKTEDDWQKTFDCVSANIGKIASFKGKLKKEKKLLEYYKLMDDIAMKLNLLFAYAQLNRDTDSKNVKYITMQN